MIFCPRTNTSLGHLSPTSLYPERLQRAHYCNAYHQAQAFELANATIHTQDKAVIEVFGKWADPLAATSAAAGALPLGQDEKWRYLPLIGKSQAFGVGRVDDFVNENRPLLAFGKPGDCLRFEQSQGCRHADSRAHEPCEW